MSDIKKDGALESTKEPTTGFAALMAEAADAATWKALAIKARAVEEGLREQIRQRDRLIGLADDRVYERIQEVREEHAKRVRALEAERDEARAGEKRAVEELEAMKKSTSDVWAALEHVKGKGAVAKETAKKGGE